MIKRGTKNSILVELEKISEDEYQFSSGVKLFRNNRYESKQNGHLQLDVLAHNQRIYGTCVAIQEVLAKGDLLKFDNEDLRFTDSIEPEILPGDRVYFNYLAANNGSIVDFQGKKYCNINYSAVLCVVRNGEIIPIGGNILCDEYFGKNVSITEVNGRRVFGEKRTSGLLGIIQKPREIMAIARIIGKPLKGDTIEIQPGDVITYPEKFNFKNNIEGKDYLFIRYWDVQMIAGNEKESVI